MRRLAWFLWMLLALLPLRGWAATGMPMAEEPVTSAHGHRIEASPWHVHGAAPSMAYVGQAGIPEAFAAAAEAQAKADCGAGHATQSCEACTATAALAGRPTSLVAVIEQQDPPIWQGRSFADAGMQRLFRPPRS